MRGREGAWCRPSLLVQSGYVICHPPRCYNLSLQLSKLLSLLANLQNSFMKILPLTVSWSKNFLTHFVPHVLVHFLQIKSSVVTILGLVWSSKNLLQEAEYEQFQTKTTHIDTLEKGSRDLK